MNIILQNYANAKRIPGRPCEEPSCFDPRTRRPKTTREGKPYCDDHVEKNEYAAHVLRELARRETEEIDIVTGRASKAETADSLISQEIMNYLTQRAKSATVERLVRELNVQVVVTKIAGKDRFFDPMALVTKCGLALRAAGKVKIGQNKRHSTVLRLVD